jgi:hypothetical protein
MFTKLNLPRKLRAKRNKCRKKSRCHLFNSVILLNIVSVSVSMLIEQKLVYDSHHKLKLLPFSLYVAAAQGDSRKSLRTIVYKCKAQR